jgi:hypothetical protein
MNKSVFYKTAILLVVFLFGITQVEAKKKKKG